MAIGTKGRDSGKPSTPVKQPKTRSEEKGSAVASWFKEVFSGPKPGVADLGNEQECPTSCEFWREVATPESHRKYLP